MQAKLRELLARKDPGLAATLAELLDNRTGNVARDTAQMLAQDLVGPEHDPGVRLVAFRSLARSNADPAQLLELAQQLVQIPDLHAGLLDEANAHSGPWVDLVLAEVADRGTGSTRAWATEVVLRRNKDLTEDEALAALAMLDGPGRLHVATLLALEHLDWVRVGLLALDPDPSKAVWERGWLRSMEWWRRPDESVAALLSLPLPAIVSQNMRSAIDEIVRSGWRLSTELEPAFERFAQQGAWSTFVSALPAEAEARAIDVWQRCGPSDRLQLRTAAHSRP